MAFETGVIILGYKPRSANAQLPKQQQQRQERHKRKDHLLSEGRPIFARFPGVVAEGDVIMNNAKTSEC
jgi:hypothetical protein